MITARETELIDATRTWRSYLHRRQAQADSACRRFSPSRTRREKREEMQQQPQQQPQDEEDDEPDTEIQMPGGEKISPEELLKKLEEDITGAIPGEERAASVPYSPAFPLNLIGSSGSVNLPLTSSRRLQSNPPPPWPHSGRQRCSSPHRTGTLPRRCPVLQTLPSSPGT